LKLIIGIDEVGRGCLFGPVVAAAVCFRDGVSPPPGLTDSKKLTAKKRALLSKVLLSEHHVGIGSASPKEIDKVNILQASLLAMQRAFESLFKELPSNKELDIRIDGIWKIPGLDPSLMQTTIVKGDLKDQAIAAASIVAKVFRDDLVVEMEGVYPGYGLSKHKGYPTKQHKDALLKLGASDQHRRSFKGVAEAL
jgi:ribonuclease HII